MSLHWPEDLEGWLNDFQDRLDSSDAFTEKAKGWGVSFNGDILMTIGSADARPDGAKHACLRIEDGECFGAEEVEDPDFDEFGVTIQGSIEDWERMLTGERAPTRLLVEGPFDIDGPKLKMLSYRGALDELVEEARQIDVTFDRVTHSPGAR